MPDEEHIKDILRENVQPDAHVTEEQLSDVAEEITERGEISPEALEEISESVIGDPNVFIAGSIDMGDIKNELDRPKK